MPFTHRFGDKNLPALFLSSLITEYSTWLKVRVGDMESLFVIIGNVISEFRALAQSCCYQCVFCVYKPRETVLAAMADSGLCLHGSLVPISEILCSLIKHDQHWTLTNVRMDTAVTGGCE